MKNLSLLLIFFFLPFSLFASSDDLSKSKGTKQAIITALTPTPASENVSATTLLEVSFTIPLERSNIKKFDITLTCLSCKHNDKVEGSVSISDDAKELTFTPLKPLNRGLYEKHTRV